MRQVWWMLGGSAAVWATGAGVFGRDAAADLLWGVLGPLTAGVASWVVSDRTYRREPAALTGVLIAGFAAKLVFFGAYVAVMIGLLSVRPVPFMVSFTGAFIALHLVEAFGLRRLFVDAVREGTGVPGASESRTRAFD